MMNSTKHNYTIKEKEAIRQRETNRVSGKSKTVPFTYPFFLANSFSNATIASTLSIFNALYKLRRKPPTLR